MTISEFKSWLEGYEASFYGVAPTSEQYAKIKEKLGEVGRMPSAVLGDPRWLCQGSQIYKNGAFDHFDRGRGLDSSISDPNTSMVGLSSATIQRPSVVGMG